MDCRAGKDAVYARLTASPGMTEKDMRFLKRLAIGSLLLIAAFLVVVWFQPDDYRLTRQTVIAAPAAAVFAQVNDLKNWDDWSPWAKLDPNAKVTFSGPQSGPGATFKWDGNDKVGAGTMTITESKPNAAHRDAHGFHPAVRRHGQLRLRVLGGGRADQRDLEHVRPARLHQQGDVPRHEHGANAGAGCREGTGAVEAGGGEEVERQALL